MIALLLIFWAILAKRYSKHHRPHPAKTGAYFVTEGPYEFLRHPIQSGLLLMISSYAQEYFTLGRALIFIVFVIIIVIRIKSEEKSDEAYFKKDYLDYEVKTKKLIPYLY